MTSGVANYVEIDVRSAREDHSELTHGAHILLWAKTDKLLFDRHPLRALVLMTMRFDGTLGFPGGYIEQGESIEEGLCRELREEIGVDPLTLGPISADDEVCAHLVTNRFQGSDLCLHFFVKEISQQLFVEMEKNIFAAEEYGLETMGITRVPLYTMSHERGFPAFLKNNFIGHSKEQLMKGLAFAGILPPGQ